MYDDHEKPRYVTTAEAARIARLSERSIRNAYRSGDLPAFQPVTNGRVLIRLSDLVVWIESRTAAVLPEAVEPEAVSS